MAEVELQQLLDRNTCLETLFFVTVPVEIYPSLQSITDVVVGMTHIFLWRIASDDSAI